MKSTDQNIDIDLVGCFNDQVDYVWPEGYEENLDSFFEHGQWWVHDIESGASWSVVDANTESGVDFEQVADGDFDAFYNEKAREAELEKADADPELDAAVEFLKAIKDGGYDDSLHRDVDICLEANDSDPEALRLLRFWREGELQDKDWRDIDDLLKEQHHVLYMERERDTDQT
jgi:hypothetical protein